MTHLINLETLQFAFYFNQYYTGVLYHKLNCLILKPKVGVHFTRRIYMLFTGRIIWPSSLSPVNLTDFPLEQQAVPNVLRLKESAKNERTPQRHVALLMGRPGQISYHCTMDVLDRFSSWFSPLYAQFSFYPVRSR